MLTGNLGRESFHDRELNSKRTAARLLIVRFMMLCLLTSTVSGGCYGTDSAGYFYVYRQAGAHATQVASWTLQQHLGAQISNGQRALAHIASAGIPQDTDVAMEGFVQVHEKALRGWEGFVGPPKYPTWPLEKVIVDDFDILASALMVVPQNQTVRRVMLRIKPPREQRMRYSAWRDVAVRFNIKDESSQRSLKDD